MEWLFVLIDKGTKNQGWWLKIQSVEELVEYIKETQPDKSKKIVENYLQGKEWNEYHPSFKNDYHCPHYREAAFVTDAVVRYGAKHNLSILEALNGFNRMIALQQVESIMEYGAIYINKTGGYNPYFGKDDEHGFVRRKTLVFPDFKKDEIRVSKFPYGNHFYAYIGDMQVRDGNILKWNTYDEAYNMALSMIGT